MARRGCSRGPRQRPVGAPGRDPGRCGRPGGPSQPALGSTAAGWLGHHRAQSQRRLQRRSGRPRLRNRPGAVRVRPCASASGPASGRAAGPARASCARRHRRPHRPWGGPLRRARPPAGRWSGHRGARLPGAPFRRGREDVGPRRADRADHALRRRRGPAPEPPRGRGVAAGPDTRAQGRGRARLESCWSSTPRGRRLAVAPSARTRPGSTRWRRPSPTRRRPTSCAPQSRSRRDMERRARPWTAWSCGDVGYGKTEVAMRAAFKAVQDGQAGGRAGAHDRARAAALRAPSASAWRPTRSASRCSAASCRAAEQTDTLAGLAAGSVDIVIGTHRLLSRTFAFRDLGLRRGRRGAALRRRPQGAPQAAADRGRRADAVGHAHPAHAAHDPRRASAT